MKQGRFYDPRFVAICVFVVASRATPADARPAYGYDCVSCHSDIGFGHTVTNAIFDINGAFQSTIPPGQFGDPDRGVGPLASYQAPPGGDFTLSLQLKDPSTFDPPFLPTRWAIGIKRIYATDPDFQAGNPDGLTWRDNQLQLKNALVGPDFNYPDPAPIPGDSSQWSLYTTGPSFSLQQYYASTGYGGHDWIGPFALNVGVSVPIGVLPGWYDLEVSAAGWDFAQNPGFAFYDEEHFYLNVVPEPQAFLLVCMSVWVALRRRRAERFSALH